MATELAETIGVDLPQLPLVLSAALALCTVLLAVRFHKRKERGAMAATIALGSVLFFAAVYYTLVFILIGGIA